MKSEVLREKFLSFFSKKNHRVFKSDSLVPSQDPTVLFTSAGMNQFKRQFLGEISDFKRAVSCQKCLRADDLEKVGKTAYHHTFFEMLGNFSFGDYFKKEAILWAWEFLTGELELKADFLWASVYKDDDEAYSIWREEVRIPKDRILRFGEKENFWPSNAIKEGPNGPCGPCSEVFFDRGIEAGCKRKDCLPGCECGRFVEIWNLVFTQFDRKDTGVLEPLPNKNIDTGMGLERMVSVLQGVETNFKIDVFSPITKSIESLVSNQPFKESNYQFIYAISDHIRAICFAISDGVIPSNEGRGYVVRKLIRRSLLCGRSLGLNRPFLYKIAFSVSEVMGSAYPDLKENIERAKKIIFEEEEDFFFILETAPELLQREFISFKGKRGKLSGLGHIAFRLYDTYGIPLELTSDWLKKRGLEALEDEFRYDLEFQKERSRKRLPAIFEVGGLLVKEKTIFSGYKDFENKGEILKIIRENSEVNSISEGQDGVVILDRTVFYGEAGGQTGDKGIIKIKNGKLKVKSEFEITDTKVENKAILHLGRVRKGRFKIGDEVFASVDRERRRAITRAHTSTHLLQAVLREILGKHIQQAGSLVEADRLRFDFTHPKILSDEELKRIEEKVNIHILENFKVTSEIKEFEEAKREGALAFFGEKYEKKVRVVSIGDISKELCGGTHLNLTSQIGVFKILSESSIAKGIRRIEALCGGLAYQRFIEEEIEYKLKVISYEERIKAEEKKIRELEREFLRKEFYLRSKNAKDIEGIKVISEDITDLAIPTSQILKAAVDIMREFFNKTAAVVTIGLKLPGKTRLICGLTKQAEDRGLSAEKIIKRAAHILGGAGGGTSVLSEAGAKETSNLKEALDSVFEIVRDEINKIRE